MLIVAGVLIHAFETGHETCYGIPKFHYYEIMDTDALIMPAIICFDADGLLFSHHHLEFGKVINSEWLPS